MKNTITLLVVTWALIMGTGDYRYAISGFSTKEKCETLGKELSGLFRPYKCVKVD